jgi:predicted amidohydrolase
LEGILSSKSPSLQENVEIPIMQRLQIKHCCLAFALSWCLAFALSICVIHLAPAADEENDRRRPAQPPDQKAGAPVGVKAMHRAERDKRVGVAALVLPNVRGDREKALRRVETHARRAAALGAKIVVAPEACLDGYCCHESGLTKEAFSRLAESEDGRSIVQLSKLAHELDLYLCVGFTEIDKGELYNTAILLGPDGRTAGKYRKTHGVEELYKPGDELPVFDTRYGKVGILICFDRQLPETVRTLADKGARLILIASNGNWGLMNDAMLRARAYDNGVFIVFAHPRDGLVIDPGGRIIAANMSVPGQTVGLPTNVDTEDAGGWPEAVTREVDLDAWQSARGTLLLRRPKLYGKSATQAP